MARGFERVLAARALARPPCLGRPRVARLQVADAGTALEFREIMCNPGRSRVELFVNDES
eukprot:2097628-Pleurochrysis_carterae.AAC.3